jgi:type I restriction-modification system DNA methylase subunit
LNGDGLEDALVLLYSHTGGTANSLTWPGWSIRPVRSIFLGDRVQVKTMTIEQEGVTLELLTHGPNDGSCCPTVSKAQHYEPLSNHADALQSGRRPIARFYIPDKYSWAKIRNAPADSKLGEFVTTAMREVARLNPDLQRVLDVKDYSERQSGQRSLDDDRLAGLIEVVSRHRLGLKNTEPDILGRAYEYLLRKFAEGQGQSAGEFYTPKEVGWLMAELIDPAPYTTCCDPTCGSAGLLIKARLVFEQHQPGQKSQAPRLYGQELNPVTFAMAKMNMFLHDYADSFCNLTHSFAVNARVCFQ